MSALTNAERDAIASATVALPPSARAAFEQAVTVELMQLAPAMRGPGSMHRIVAQCQRQFLLDPVAVGTGGKYGRPHYARSRR